MRSTPPVPLPRAWPEATRSGILHTISLASAAVRHALSRAASGKSTLDRARAEAAWLRTEVHLLRQELEIKDDRWRRAPARRRPHYGPFQRLRILELRAARGWSVEQIARRFLVTEETIAHWMRRLDRDGEEGLVRTPEPVNKYPGFVAYMVRWLKLLHPALGKQKIAQMLARAGLHIGVSTVGRMLQRGPLGGDEEEVLPHRRSQRLRARGPNEIWHVDLTTVPTGAGFWVPWMPNSWHQRWPFAWWIAVVVDHASRYLVAVKVFRRRPTTAEVCSVLERATKRLRVRPRSIITDRGGEFRVRFRRWCRRQGIRHRHGAVGEHGSIAIVERFIRSMKGEGFRKLLVVLSSADLQRELTIYGAWYNRHRPHSALAGCTPGEVYRGRRPRNQKPRLEPRAEWPRKARCAAPWAKVSGDPGARFRLELGRFKGRRHLPVLELRRAA